MSFWLRAELYSYILYNDGIILYLNVFLSSVIGSNSFNGSNSSRVYPFTSLSFIKIYEYNSARSQKDISIFEIGKGFYKKGEVYGEDTKLCALMTGKYSIGLGNSKVVDFYTIKGIAEEMLDGVVKQGKKNVATVEDDKIVIK